MDIFGGYHGTGFVPPNFTVHCRRWVLHVRMHSNVCACIFTCVHIYAYIYIYMYMVVPMRIYIYKYVQPKHMLKKAYVSAKDPESEHENPPKFLYT